MKSDINIHEHAPNHEYFYEIITSDFQKNGPYIL